MTLTSLFPLYSSGKFLRHNPKTICVLLDIMEGHKEKIQLVFKHNRSIYIYMNCKHFGTFLAVVDSLRTQQCWEQLRWVVLLERRLV